MQMQKGFDVVNLHGTASGVIATPYIGENENWWIGNEDTGINARGEKGDQGEIGPQGPKGDQAADMSRIEALEAKYEQLNSNLKQTYSGHYIGASIPTNTRIIATITFPQPFKRPPNVIVCTNYGTGNPQLVAVDVGLVTETEAQIMCWQNLGLPVPANFYWFATATE